MRRQAYLHRSNAVNLARMYPDEPWHRFFVKQAIITYMPYYVNDRLRISIDLETRADASRGTKS
jgi:hypothetical protein